MSSFRGVRDVVVSKGQLRAVRPPDAADRAGRGAAALREGEGEGAPAHGREPVGVARAAASAALRRGRDAAPEAPGGGRLGGPEPGSGNRTVYLF